MIYRKWCGDVLQEISWVPLYSLTRMLMLMFILRFRNKTWIYWCINNRRFARYCISTGQCASSYCYNDSEMARECGKVAWIYWYELAALFSESRLESDWELMGHSRTGALSIISWYKVLSWISWNVKSILKKRLHKVWWRYCRGCAKSVDREYAGEYVSRIWDEGLVYKILKSYP